MLIVRRELIAIDQKDFDVFAGKNHQMWVSSGLVRQQHRTTAAQIEVFALQKRLIIRGEPIADSQSVIGRELQKRIPIFGPTADVGVETAVAGGQVNIAGGVNSRRAAAHPDSAFTRRRSRSIRCPDVRSGVKKVIGDLLETGFVITDNPSVIGIGISITGITDIHDIPQQEQTAPLLLLLRIENYLTTRAIDSGPGDGSRDDYWTVRPLGAVKDVERMQA